MLSYCGVRRTRVQVSRTFFPAYLPRVMMATRPTLRTTQSPSASVVHSTQLPCLLTLHRCCRRSLGVVIEGLVFRGCQNSLWKGLAALPVEIAGLVTLARCRFLLSTSATCISALRNVYNYWSPRHWLSCMFITSLSHRNYSCRITSRRQQLLVCFRTCNRRVANRQIHQMST